jgi:N-acetylglucosamine-6-sulfatase
VPQQLSRREALQGIAATVAGATALPACLESPAARDRRPNLVLFVADDQAAKALGATGAFPFLATPGMDRLAAEGASFANAFVTTSLCSPARASLLTGCYAHTHGVRQNGVADPDDSLPLFPALLQDAGYRTAFIGKWHMASGATASPRPGFDTWVSFPGQGEYDDPAINDNGVLQRVPGYMTDLLTDYAVRFIAEHAAEPFCLILAHKAVHDPRTPAPRHLDAFPDAALPEPPSFADDCYGKPRWLRRAILYGESPEAWAASATLPVPERLPPATWDAHDPALLRYLRCLLALDDSVRRVTDALEREGLLDHTCVIHTSDNGYFLGEHRRADKRLMYEESIRVPLLVRYPPRVRAGSTLSPLVLNLDLAPTLLELAGVTPPPGMHGRSLWPVLEDDAAPWRQSFLYEYWVDPWAPAFPLTQGVRTAQYKLIRFPEVTGDTDELYDLVNDPLELDNRIADPMRAAVVAALDAELRALLET